jgi:hypothetical protein
MRGVFYLVLIGFIGLFGFVNLKPEEKAKREIIDLREGTLLVRLHTDEAVISKMKQFHKDKERKHKIKEIYERNLAQYKAFSTVYNFSEIVFFFGKDSEKVKGREFENIFLNEELKIDTSIKIDDSKPIFILDVGDVYFEHMSGHQEGVVIMNSKFEQLQKPFPFYVRKRSGMAIIKRTDLDVALILDQNLTKFYRSVNPVAMED